MKYQILFLVGPTAIGKTEVSVKIAQEINAEIISCDSMQVYKEINILNANPPKKYLEEIPHHLIGIISVREEFNVAKFYDLAQKRIEEILNRGKIPLCVGGSGLYIDVLLYGIFPFSDKDPELRRELFQKALQEGRIVLYEELKKIDPISAQNIHPNDLRRIIRALEVYKLTGVPLSELKTKREGLMNKYKIRMFGLIANRMEIYRRIEERVEDMFRKDAIREVEEVFKIGPSSTCLQLIGLKEIKDYLDGKVSLQEAKELMKKNTRKFAKRQLTWFKREKKISWVRVEGLECKEVVNLLLRKIEK